jgi:hypothetical protein
MITAEPGFVEDRRGTYPVTIRYRDTGLGLAPRQFHGKVALRRTEE